MNTSVRSLSNSLSRDENRYKKVVICAGTNDCSRDNFNIDTVAEQFGELLQVATNKVAGVDNVLVSSIPPRTDNVAHQQRVEELNTVLQDLAIKAGVNFVSNDKSFRLADGQPNDGYLHNDGIHLNRRGTLRIIGNLGLVMPSTSDNKECAQRNSDDLSHDDWQTVRPKRNRPSLRPRRHEGYVPAYARREGHVPTPPRRERNMPESPRPFSRNSELHEPHAGSENRRRHLNTMTPQGRRGADSNNQPGRPCAYCNEHNHSEKNCRHGQPITCHLCGQPGHKEKWHQY